MRLSSSRFGSLDVPDDAIVEFPSGLIGLGGNRYALLADGEDPDIVWLQSLDDPELALPVTNPWRHFAEYDLELTPQDAERMGLEDPSSASVYVTVRAVDGVTVNLRAPIVVVGNRGYQVINQAQNADVRVRIGST
jgi:flagellar assembly factor FliW